jgi:membrane fusion protein (multidrug efflux system)
MPKLTRGMGVILIIMIAITAALLYLNSRRGSEVLQDLPAPVVVTKPRTGSLSRTIRVTGITKSRSTVTVFPRISGRLDELNVSMGDFIQEDQVLGRIDSEPYDLALQQAQAALSGAQATYKRVESLFKSNSVSRQNYDEALANYESARALHAMAALNVEWSEIRSPLKGTVLETHMEKGSLLSPQVPLLTIADLTYPELSLELPELYYGKFQDLGSSLIVVIIIPALNHDQFSCRIKTIAPWISPESKTFRVDLIIDDPRDIVRPGMFATVLVELESEKDVAVLDWQALSSEGLLWYLEEGNIPHKIKYDPPLKGDEGFQVPPGMEDVSFILEGQHFLTEGVAVRIVEP